MSLFVRRCSVVVALSILAACGEVELSCEPDGDVTPLCGVQMPEDLEVMPNGGGLLIGEYGNGGQLPGAITWYQPGAGAEFIQLVNSIRCVCFYETDFMYVHGKIQDELQVSRNLSLTQYRLGTLSFFNQSFLVYTRLKC